MLGQPEIPNIYLISAMKVTKCHCAINPELRYSFQYFSMQNCKHQGSNLTVMKRNGHWEYEKRL
uniref:Uncharacterized protein n=1 Tax=Arundo donax TaxID=35708 RepID=A0A0A8Y322_ARUDO